MEIYTGTIKEKYKWDHCLCLKFMSSNTRLVAYLKIGGWVSLFKGTLRNLTDAIYLK